MNWFCNISFPINKLEKDSYNTILVIIDRLIKIVYYKTVKTTINDAGLAKIIIDVIVRHSGIYKSIISDQDLLFTLKFKSLLF